MSDSCADIPALVDDDDADDDPAPPTPEQLEAYKALLAMPLARMRANLQNGDATLN